MSDTIEKPAVNEHPVDVKAAFGTLFVEHSGILADLFRRVSDLEKLGDFFSRELSEALERELKSRVGGIKEDIFIPPGLIAVEGRRVLLRGCSARVVGIVIEEGSTKIKLHYVLGALATIYTGVITFPDFEDGIFRIHSRIEKVIQEGFYKEYRRCLIEDVGKYDYKKFKGIHTTFSDLLRGPEPEITPEMRQELVSNEKISIHNKVRGIEVFLEDLKMDIKMNLDKLPEHD